jgi:hypothetical protein
VTAESLDSVTREDRDRYIEIWSGAATSVRAQALCSTLKLALRSIERPTLRDLLALVHECGFDVAGSPAAGEMTLAEALGHPPSGPSINSIIDSLELDVEAPLQDAEELGVDVTAELASLLVVQ